MYSDAIGTVPKAEVVIAGRLRSTAVLTGTAASRR
jgi:hypothetical protein